ncbi:hypothetical protein [uncultured Selenomonas sp.]|uniref:hypothetical protein n=1 Tax=uncultured Selenomonas sp. TaxID=159275 RepID=UPI0028E2126E|nr:hypothetical protein [uncultured Selenomonas sp.]
MSTLKTVGMAAAVLATGLVGYGIYKAMQDEDEQVPSSDDVTDWDEEEDADEEVFDDAEDDVVYG